LHAYEIDQDSILDELNQLKKEHEENKKRLEIYLKTKKHIEDLEKAEKRLF